MEITYGLPQPTDADAMYIVESTCFSDDEQLSRDEMNVNLTNHRKTCMVARDKDGHIIGIMIGSPIDHEHLNDDDYVAADLTDQPTKYFAILSLAVLPSAQGHGIAGQLIRRALLLAKLMDKKAVVLDCKNELIPFYKNHQFKENGKSLTTFAGIKWNSMIHPI